MPDRRALGRLAMMVAAALCIPAAAAAQSPAAGLPLEQQVEMCGACHGPDGNAALPEFPSLAGQPALFVTTQMIYFRERLRRSELMTPQAQGLRDREIEALAAYYAELPVRPADDALRPIDEQLMARGRALAGALRCASCHLLDYSGRQQIPRLAGQREDYLVMTMIAYRDRMRGGPDTTMIDVLRGLSDQDIEALAHFVARGGHQAGPR